MPLPTPAKSDVTPIVAAAPVAVAEKGDVKIKQFGPAKDANDVAIPAPTPCGVDLVALASKLADAVKAELTALNVDVQAFVNSLELNKETVPGHKAGRIAYGMASVIGNIFKYVGLATKERGAGGFAKMKADIQKKDDQVAKLRAQLIKLGMSEAEVDKSLAGE